MEIDILVMLGSDVISRECVENEVGIIEKMKIVIYIVLEKNTRK